MPSDAQPEPIIPGLDGTPVPGGIRAIRMGNEPKLDNLSPEALRRVQEGKAIPSFFKLSSEDEKQIVPRLSVWLEPLTSVAQAWILVGANLKRRWVLFLKIDQIRTVIAPAVEKFPQTPPLEVEWERATRLTEAGDRVPETRTGWEGHAGITNLNKGNKTQREAIRWQLADLAVVQILSEEDLTSFINEQKSDHKSSSTPS
ncbi:hypothetical protein J8F10_25540 [Gemmata sp. G18]|uniref:Uncharacterized protein n=1 Tax=Gemmata palustris TaxID=2822762 RepID=A0ABS5BZG0_9BACT|nr:hypothetical protein [Gemmata palustris]MBP3958625.1 hypothetical protein [Gemmata palustris]